MIVCLGLAKTVKNDLSFIKQMSLGGLNAVKMLRTKGDVSVDVKPHGILIGDIGDLVKKFDIPIEQFKLDLKFQAMLLFDKALDRPLLVHQSTAQGSLHSLIHEWNVDDIITSVDEYEHDGEMIGHLLSISEKQKKVLQFYRESGKFGKWKIRTD